MSERRRGRAQAVRETLVAGIARLRVALGFVFGVLVLILAQPTRRSLIVGMSIAACGELFRMWAAGHIHKSREITTSGPYRWVPHPLYLGSSVMGIGLAVACASIPVGILIAMYLVTALTSAIKSEETYLRRAFGDQYDLYRSGIEAKRRSSGPASRRRFSLAQAMANREWRAVIGLVIGMLLLIWKATYNDSF